MGGLHLHGRLDVFGGDMTRGMHVKEEYFSERRCHARSKIQVTDLFLIGYELT